MQRLMVDAGRCSGCRICELICSFRHEGCFKPSQSRIRVQINRFIDAQSTADAIDVPQVCRQCNPAACAEACPEDAIVTDDISKCRRIEIDRCSGCGLCDSACPYGMIVMDDRLQTAKKCDLCGGESQCVQFCPQEALKVGDV